MIMPTTIELGPPAWVAPTLQWGSLAVILTLLLVKPGLHRIIRTHSGRTLVWMSVMAWSAVAAFLFGLPPIQGLIAWFCTTLVLMVIPGLKREPDVEGLMRAIREQMRRNGRDIR